MWVRQAFLDLIALFFLVCTIQARLVNISIDDTQGDHINGKAEISQCIVVCCDIL